jgi:hypothetical protein
MNGRLIRGRMAVIAAATLWAVAVTPGGAAAAGPAGSMTGQAAQRAAMTAHHQAATRLQKELRSHVPAGHRARPARVSPLNASGTTLCVGGGAGCYPTIQAALDASHDGDTVRVGAGTYAGGITITRSIRLLGSGAASTIIKGGGSVITIGEYGAAVEPTVVISGVTVTGGYATSSPESVPFVGQDGVIALGGGVEIPPNADFSGGADVTITESVITGNRVAPTQTEPFGPPCPDGNACPFAWAIGGGIDSWGKLTLTDTVVSHNRAGAASGPASLASDAEAGGIRSWLGALTLVRTSVDDNAAVAAGPNGRFADGGGVFLEGGSLSMTGSSVSHNTALLAASLPDSVDLAAVAGGIHIAGGVAATIRNSRFVGNAVAMTNSVGYANAFSGGLHADPDITASGVVISGNTVTASGIDFASGDSGAGEMGATFSGAIISGNTVTITAKNGWAIGGGGASIYRGSLSGSVISGNHITASSPNGGVSVAGGALVGDVGGISLTNSEISRNSVQGNGLEGSVLGGGIFDALTAGPPGGPLNLTQSSVTWNTASGSAGMTVQGGGVYTDNVVTSTDSVIAHNQPDQCVGC